MPISIRVRLATDQGRDIIANHLAATGECTALARQNIRMGFHDCGTWNLTDGDTGGCDGSIILAGLVCSFLVPEIIEEFTTTGNHF